MTLSTALLYSSILEIHFFSNIHFRLIVITFDYEATTFKTGAISGRTIIFDLRTIGLDFVATTIARLGAMLLAITRAYATVTARASTFFVIATILVLALSSLVAAHLKLVTAALCPGIAFVVRNSINSCSGHSNQNKQEGNNNESHHWKNYVLCSSSSNPSGRVGRGGSGDIA